MKKILIITGILLSVGVAYWLISPLFIDKTVNEALPPGAGDTTRPADKVSPNSKEEGTNLEDQVPEDMMNEFMDAMKGTEDVSMSEEVPAGGIASSQVAKIGTFVSVAHEGSGTAKLLPFPQGNIVRLEDLDVDNGPDLHVVLSKEQDIRSSEDLGEYIELGKLKGNKGNQNYQVPDNINISEYHSVVIYCKAFSVVFNSANLE